MKVDLVYCTPNEYRYRAAELKVDTDREVLTKLNDPKHPNESIPLPCLNGSDQDQADIFQQIIQLKENELMHSKFRDAIYMFRVGWPSSFLNTNCIKFLDLPGYPDNSGNLLQHRRMLIRACVPIINIVCAFMSFGAGIAVASRHPDLADPSSHSVV